MFESPAHNIDDVTLSFIGTKGAARWDPAMIGLEILGILIAANPIVASPMRLRQSEISAYPARK
jgi:hypothetical protein